MTRFEPGARVRVLDLDRHGHVRTPRYVRGKTGRVVRPLGRFPNPEDLAYGGDGLLEKELYEVAFDQADLWDGYESPAHDELHVGVYEHWLEGA